jgi:DNA-binding transcriptional regulator YiaG
MDADQLSARNAAIRAAWDDPLRRALQRERALSRCYPKKKLTDAAYAEIRALHRRFGYSIRELARVYGVSRSTVFSILSR